MAYNHDNEFNEEKIALFLQESVKNVENASEQDIKAFDKIKKLIKKNVPFSRRKYVYAFLVKNAAMSFRSNRFRKDKDERFSRGKKTERNLRSENLSIVPEERRERPPRIQIDPSASTTIFIGIGHNRRVSPRDLVGLLVSVSGLEKQRIGEIRVLANYSFIQLYTEDCEKVIATLNGYEYRGKKLSVSYSKKKEDGDELVANSSENSSEIEKSSNETEKKSYRFADEDTIPSNVSNEGHSDNSVNLEEEKIAAEQKAFAAQQKASSSSDLANEKEIVKPFSETTDDGQVKSHFGDGAAY